MNTVTEQNAHSVLRERRIEALPYELSYRRIVIAGLLELSDMPRIMAFFYHLFGLLVLSLTQNLSAMYESSKLFADKDG